MRSPADLVQSPEDVVQSPEELVQIPEDLAQSPEDFVSESAGSAAVQALLATTAAGMSASARKSIALLVPSSSCSCHVCVFVYWCAL